jgi:hypothetical protein
MPVYAVQAGTVIEAGDAQGYGGPDPAGWLVIDSTTEQGGGAFEYGHIVRLPDITVGTEVLAGQQIATINPNRASNGGVAPHLHLSAWPYALDQGAKIDPLPLLAGAQEPGGPTMPDPAAPRPDFNEYPLWSANNQSRAGTKVDLWLIHTQEGNGNADSLARWMQGDVGVSYHYTVSQDPRDNGVTVCDVVDTDLASWSALNANNRSINLVFAGSRAAWTRAEWMRQSRAIDVAAYLCAKDCRKYGIPIKVMPRGKYGPPGGISDHYYVTKYLGIGDHSDVGPNFPWDYFTERVNAYAGLSKPEPVKPPAPVGPADDQLTMRWNSLGGQTLVEAVAQIRDKVLGTSDRMKPGAK